MLLRMLVSTLMAMILQRWKPLSASRKDLCKIVLAEWRSVMRQIAKKMRLIVTPLWHPHPAALVILSCTRQSLTVPALSRQALTV